MRLTLSSLLLLSPQWYWDDASLRDIWLWRLLTGASDHYCSRTTLLMKFRVNEKSFIFASNPLIAFGPTKTNKQTHTHSLTPITCSHNWKCATKCHWKLQFSVNQLAIGMASGRTHYSRTREFLLGTPSARNNNIFFAMCGFGLRQSDIIMDIAINFYCYADTSWPPSWFWIHTLCMTLNFGQLDAAADAAVTTAKFSGVCACVWALPKKNSPCAFYIKQ